MNDLRGHRLDDQTLCSHRHCPARPLRFMCVHQLLQTSQADPRLHVGVDVDYPYLLIADSSNHCALRLDYLSSCYPLVHARSLRISSSDEVIRPTSEVKVLGHGNKVLDGTLPNPSIIFIPRDRPTGTDAAHHDVAPTWRSICWGGGELSPGR